MPRKDDGKIIQGLKLCFRKGNRSFVVLLVCLIGLILYMNLADFKIKVGVFEFESVSNMEYFKKKCRAR